MPTNKNINIHYSRPTMIPPLAFF